jgi:hypothetical protein
MNDTVGSILAIVAVLFTSGVIDPVARASDVPAQYEP